MTAFKDIMNLAGIRSCQTIEKNKLPMKLLYGDKEYIIKATNNDRLVMVKNETMESKEDIVKQ